MPQQINSILPSIITSLSGFAGVIIGFGLGLIAFILQEKIRRRGAQAELMRSLIMEVQTDRMRCHDIANNIPATALLETVSWDRVRYSDCLYSCITSRDTSIYHQLLRGYSEILYVNFTIAQYFSALDGNRRFPTPDNERVVNTTLGFIRNAASIILPTLQTLEESLNAFLIREGFFRKG